VQFIYAGGVRVLIVDGANVVGSWPAGEDGAILNRARVGLRGRRDY
jgi:predicted RNA-binding protein with PIN domain